MAESMTGLKRTHRCAELSEANIGEKVTIMGWVQKNRNKGGLVFVDVHPEKPDDEKPCGYPRTSVHGKRRIP